MRRFAMVLLLLLLPIGLSAQAKKGLRARIAAANAAADSSNFKVEFGSDINVTQTGDSLPASVRLGLITGDVLTLEAAAAAQQDSSYIEADISLGVTAAIFPGATSVHGQFLHAAVAYRTTENNSYQLGVIFGTGMREVATNGIAVRAGVFTEYLFPHSGNPGTTIVGARVGFSFWR